MHGPRKYLIAYLLLLCFGYFGAHRFYTHRRKTAFVLLAISIVQIMIIAVTFMTPLSLWLIPPYSAAQNLHAAIDILFSKPLSSVAPAQAIEAAYVRPALWLATLPSLISTLWVIKDALTPATWFEASKTPSEKNNVLGE